MAWGDVGTNQMVSYTDAQGGGFTLKPGQSSVTSNQCMTKNDAFTKYYLQTTTNTNTVASNQLMRKDYWVGATLLPYSYTFYYASADGDPNWGGFNTSSEACAATSFSATVYSSSSSIVVGMELFYDQYGTIPLNCTSYDQSGYDYYKINSTLIQFVNEGFFGGNQVYSTSACVSDQCYSLPEIGRDTSSSSVACNNANSGIYVLVSANADTLLGATLLYRNCSTKPAAVAGWYSDGARARQWNGSAFVGSPVQCII